MMTTAGAHPAFFFDTHAHSDAFNELDWNAVAGRALARGVKGNLSAGVWWDQFDRLVLEFAKSILCRAADRRSLLNELLLSGRYCILPALGLHPMEIAVRWKTATGEFDRLRAKDDVEIFSERALKHRDLIWAVGETGFDVSAKVAEGWRSKTELLNAQTYAFESSVRVALDLNLPIIVHSRAAWKKTLDEVDNALALGLRSFMIHCYGGPAEDLRWIEQRKGFASFGGVMTWPDARRVRQALVECPDSVLLFETDSPDLPPVLGDGQRPAINEPGYLCDILACAAELRRQSVSELAEMNINNFLRFLGY